MGKRLALMLVVIAMVAFPAAQPAGANHGEKCGFVSKGSGDYRVLSRGMACRSARKWIKRYLIRGSHPRGYSCLDPAAIVRVYCSRGSTSYWAIRL